MEYFIYSFEKLEVWQLGRDIRIRLYSLFKQFPKSELFGLIIQMKRASHSITHNLAEGSGRESKKEKAHFTAISKGSALELLDQIIAAHDLKFIDTCQYGDLRKDMDLLINKLNAFYISRTKL